ncbi:MAG: alpha-galactosidase, partial [Acidobacteriaceae bacterium]|nr:alpha-galactosidase [Acidobacteriaceae bacterium]
QSGFAPTPPMGWASWNHFFCDYDEKTIHAQADALVSSGMKDAGYKYVVIQECIASKRDAEGNLLPDSKRFPSGMPALVDYIHSLGLKAGIYTDIGPYTCAHYLGSFGHEQQDANTFAAWGMDFVEMDYCYGDTAHSGRWEYERMAEAIKHTGRPMLFYICSWGNEQPWEWAQSKAQMWRTENDISSQKNIVTWQEVVRNFESNSAHSVFSGPESWNDADMLEIGNPGLSDTEAQAHMSMWAISPSGLLAGADLTQMSKTIRDIYTNREVLAVNQDSLGAGAEMLPHVRTGLEVWARPLGTRTGGDYAVMLLNATEKPETMDVSWSQLDLLPGPQVRDLWLHRDLSDARDGYSSTVPAHAAVMLRIHGTRAWNRGVVFEAESPAQERIGAASLATCGECSQGFAIALSGSNKPGSLKIGNVVVPSAGAYVLRLLFVRNGMGDRPISVKVNGAEIQTKALSTSWGKTDVPITLQSGDNEITISFTGDRELYLDRAELLRPDTGHKVSVVK